MVTEDHIYLNFQTLATGLFQHDNIKKLDIFSTVKMLLK